MADPITLGVGALAMGSVVSAVGSIAGGSAQAAQLQAQSQAANYNAMLNERQAAQASAAAVAQSNLQKRQIDQALGTQRAATAQSGIGFEGTGGDLLAQSQKNAELDRENTLYNGIIQNSNYQSQAEMNRYQGKVAESQIGSAITSGYIGAGASLLTGFGRYAFAKTPGFARGYM